MLRPAFSPGSASAADSRDRDPLPRGAVVEIPAALRIDEPSTEVYDIVILGAGCAGLSLAVALVNERVPGRILLVDARDSYADDRTWCFWDVEPTPFTHLARASWPTWTVRSRAGRVESTAHATPYRCLAANDFYRFALEGLAESGTVELLASAPAHEVSSADDDDLVTVTTGRGTIRARRVVDSRGLRPGSAEMEEARSRSTWVPQEFVGVHLRATTPVFDDRACVLMDFDVDQSSGLRFVYVLPLSPFEALVEDVSMSDPVATDVEHRRNLDDYLLRHYGLASTDYEVLALERGYIPMTTHAFRREPLPNVTTLGTLAGATRPSTGYTFLRIQRSSRVLARRLAASAGGDPVDENRSLPDRAAGSSLLDAIFLRFLSERPALTPRVFHLLFSRVPAASLVRFLSEQGTFVDHARLVLALPKGIFLRTAFRELLVRASRVRRR